MIMTPSLLGKWARARERGTEMPRQQRPNATNRASPLSNPPSRSLPGLIPQVGFTRLAAPSITELGQARVPMQSIVFQKMDARVISAFTRVFDALLPAHDTEAEAASEQHERRGQAWPIFRV